MIAMRCVALFLLCVCLVCACGAVSALSDAPVQVEATHIHPRHGVIQSRTQAPQQMLSFSDSEPSGDASPEDKGMTLVWTQNAQYGIFSSVRLLNGKYNGTETNMLLSGMTLNQPFAAQLRPVVKDAPPMWFIDEMGDVDVDASKPGVIGMHGQNAYNSASSVLGLKDETAVPFTWNYTCGSDAAPCQPDQVNAVVVSADGKRIISSFTHVDFSLGPYVTIPIFEASTGKILYEFQSERMMGGRGIVASGDGSRVGAIILSADPHAQGYAMVFDIQGKVLMKTPYQVGAQAICMSKSGKYFAYGFLSLYLWEFQEDKGEYVLVSTIPGQGKRLLTTCAFDEDSNDLGLGWESEGFNQNQIELHSVPIPSGGTPKWSYLYKQSQDQYEDAPWAMRVMTGRPGFNETLLAVGSWSDSQVTNPQVHVFSTILPEPLGTYQTAGSVFAIDMEFNAQDPLIVSVAVGCKHVHANQMGNGGDLYALQVGLPI